MNHFYSFSNIKARLTRKVSLAELHLFFSIFIIIFTLGLSIVFSVLEDKEYQVEKNSHLLEQSYRLNTALYEKINFVENIMGFVAEKIVQSNDYSYPNIEFLISYKRLSTRYNSLCTIMAFVNLNYEIVIDSKSGIYKHPVAMPKTELPWFQSAYQKPWGLQFSQPIISPMNDQVALSAAMAITTEDNKFIGYLSSSLHLDRLRHSLKDLVGDRVQFILLDTNHDFLLASDDKFMENRQNISFPVELDDFQYQESNILHLENPITIYDTVFTLISSTDRYPFIFLIGQNADHYYGEFRNEILPNLIKNIVLGGVLVLVLLFISYLVVKPIIELSNIADDILKGKNVEVPAYISLEVNNLSTHLANIQSMAKDLRLKQEELTQANANLTQANEFIQSNMSFLSHELRNPTSGIIGFSKLLKDRLTQPEQKENKEYSEFIYNIAKHQDKQIDFFLKLFEFQAKGKILEDKEINLVQVIESNINMVMHHAYHKKTKIIVKIDPNLPNMIGDDIMIGQMVQNFVTNAIKYNKEGGSLEVKAFTRFYNRKKEVVIQFKDTGIGIDQKDLEKLFKKFERIQNTKTEGIMGYGLGLAFAKTCIVAHDGEIEVVSEVGIGTVFTVRFPRARIIEKEI